jgi:mersacidin/lichenicidin family type 2 lantibiotic
MVEHDLVRAWKDRRYRRSLPEATRSRLPENPAGAVELPDDELAAVAGGLEVAAGASVIEPGGYTVGSWCPVALDPTA